MSKYTTGEIAKLCGVSVRTVMTNNNVSAYLMSKCGPLEKGMANHISILALRTPWTV